ncbi:MAG: hypothetical protein AAF206_06545, partial [Bacteroidota bacterium]
MLQKTTLLLLCMGLAILSFGQHRPTCLTMEQDMVRRLNHPELGNLTDFEDWLQDKICHTPTTQRASLITIPIVFHIVHDGENLGMGHNLAQSQIQSQLDVLNEDFRRLPGTPGFNNDPVGADIEIEFCLATVAPDSSILAEPGIHRLDRNQEGWQAFPYNASYIEQTVKVASSWDPDAYFNVWVVELSGLDLGYAQWPDASGLSGVPTGSCCANTDGVVINFSNVGRNGSAIAPYDQ